MGKVFANQIVIPAQAGILGAADADMSQLKP